MQVQLASDLHLEFFVDHGRRFIDTIPVAAPNLILAGDIFVVTSTEQAIKVLGWFCAKWERVFYLPGNHEYYKGTFTGVDGRLKAAKACLKNLTLLRTGGVVEVEGRRLLGDTMWFPFKPDNVLFAKDISDFHLIERLDPQAYDRNARFKSFLEKELRAGDIVVTHHLPSWKSVKPQFFRSPLNRFFVSDERELIEIRKPAYWFHGHSHLASNYTIGPTIVASNPRGYPGSSNIKLWKPTLIFEV
jgi:DNA repair exonuclease SbcCD nuclease subunit